MRPRTIRRVITGLALGSLLLVTGCGRWYHATKVQPDYYADAAQCNAQGGSAGTFAGPIHGWNIIQYCMRGKGWVKQPTYAGQRGYR